MEDMEIVVNKSQRHRTRMTRIARIFTDMWSSVPSVKSLNALQSAQSIDARIFASFMLWHEKINNELIRTTYELTLPEFVSVRISSLFSRCYLAGLLDINSPYIAAFFRVHPRLIFNREMRERGGVAG